MFDFIRSHQRLMQFILLVLILPSFALIGVSGYTSYVSGDHDLVEVGKAGVTQQEFDVARRDQLQRIQASLGAAFDPAVFDTPDTRRALLESLIERRVIISQLEKHRFNVSDASLRNMIANVPEFQENGEFSPERYRFSLMGMGISSADFEQSQRGEMALHRVLGPIAATAHVPDSTIGMIGQALTEQRVIRMRQIAARDYRDGIQVDDAQIQAWYDANQAALQIPESVVAEYLLLDEAAATQNVAAVSDADLRDYYDQNKARYVQAARADVSHIQFNVPAGATDDERAAVRQQAQEVAALAAKPDADFAELAKAHSQDAGTAANGGGLGWITQGGWPAQIETAVFALQSGQVSDAVEVEGNYHVFRLNQLQPEQGESFEQARDQVEQEVRRQLAADQFADMATRLTDLIYDDNTDLAPVAQSLGLALRQAQGIAADRLLPAEQLASDDVPVAAASDDVVLLNDPRVRRALFSEASRQQQHSSGIIEISPGVMVVVRATRFVPAHVQPFDQARDAIHERLVAEQAHQAAVKAGEAVLATLRETDDVAVPEGFSDALRISRMDSQGLSEDVLRTVFELRSYALPAVIGVEDAQGYALVRLESVQPGQLDDVMRVSLQAQLAQVRATAEQRAVLAVMREQANVKVLPEAQEALEQSDDQLAG